MASSSSSLPLIDVAALRVGMYVHLDLSWMSHPFPLSRFRISAQSQIDTIRGLGLRQVRWNPQESVPEAPQPAAHSESPADDVPAQDTAQVLLHPAAQDNPHRAANEPRLSDDATQRRVRLEDEQRALANCERQFAEAARDCRAILDLAFRDPVSAGQNAGRLARAFADKMMGSKDLCIRVLSGSVGERASTHAVNVSILSMLMGHAFSWDESDMMDIGVGALMHDVGKLDLPDRVRYRRDDLSSAESRMYQQHVSIGVAQGRKMQLSPGALAVIEDHHEAVDKSGFPRGLSGDRMSAAARVVALVDRFDNLCNPIQISQAVTPHEAVSMMFAQHKNKFDITILGAFIKLMGVYPAGSVVQLTDSRYAMVMAVKSALHSSRALKPMVLAFDARVSRDEAEMIDLESRSDLSIFRSVRPHALPPDVRQYLQPRARLVYGFEHAD